MTGSWGAGDPLNFRRGSDLALSKDSERPFPEWELDAFFVGFHPGQALPGSPRRIGEV